MKTIPMKTAMQGVSALGLILCVFIALWGFQSGILTSQQAMQDFISGFGAMGILVFTLFQAIQVVVPILPGGLGCLVGVLLFGSVKGFFCNYIGICIGSMMAFAIAKNCGRPLLPKLFSQKTIQKYEGWTNGDSPFAAWFALAIFLPVAPDDFLCYLAGTTSMSWQRFTMIIWLCKPFSIALYSLGLIAIWERVLSLM